MPVVRSQCRCDRARIAQIAHGRLEVDDRFGWQIGYSGGADVLDVGDQPGCEQRFEVVAFPRLARSRRGRRRRDRRVRWARPASAGLLTVTRYRDATSPQEEAVAIPAPILAPLRRWMRVRGPVLDDPFDEAIDDAQSSLTSDLRAAMSNVEIVVEDEPPDGQPLLGLYRAYRCREGAARKRSASRQISIFGERSRDSAAAAPLVSSCRLLRHLPRVALLLRAPLTLIADDTTKSPMPEGTRAHRVDNLIGAAIGEIHALAGAPA